MKNLPLCDSRVEFQSQLTSQLTLTLQLVSPFQFMTIVSPVDMLTAETAWQKNGLTDSVLCLRFVSFEFLAPINISLEPNLCEPVGVTVIIVIIIIMSSCPTAPWCSCDRLSSSKLSLAWII